MAKENEILVPAPVVASEFKVSRRTLSRWLNDPKLNFPQPATINGRLYFGRHELEKWKIDRLRAALVAA